MNENIQDRREKGSARRRLIRGAFAAPAVLTLYSGSVAAASLLCSDKPPSVPVPTVTSATDSYLRYQLYGLVKNSSGRREIDSYYISGDEFKSMVRVGFSPPAGQWQQFDMNTKKLIGSTLITRPAKNNYTLQRVHQFVALRVDSSGVVVDVGDGPAGFVASESCMLSLMVFN